MRKIIVAAFMVLGVVWLTPGAVFAHHTTITCVDKETATWSIVNSENKTMTYTTSAGQTGTIGKKGTATVVYEGTELSVDGVWSNGVTRTNVGRGDCVPTPPPVTTEPPPTVPPTTEPPVTIPPVIIPPTIDPCLVNPNFCPITPPVTEPPTVPEPPVEPPVVVEPPAQPPTPPTVSVVEPPVPTAPPVVNPPVTATQPPISPPSPSSPSLPETGNEIWVIAAVATMLLGLGYILRRFAK